MSLFKYKWGQDENGEEGWISELHPNFDASQGSLIVHDCFEHLPRGQKHGGAADELLALGARAWLRIDSGHYWSGITMQSPPVTWGSEIMNIERYMPLADIPRCKPIEPLELDCEDELAACLAHAAKDINGEHYYEDDYVPIEADDPHLINCLYWLRTGARAAVKRYKDRHPSDVMWLAEQMEKELRTFRHGEEGDRLHVRIHEKNLEYSIDHKPMYD